ncbi:helix-turn-helix domain-containing protein (plasmid) [Nocardia sp. CA-151230]|uniref:helix-turn-helix domain-containing protein n=1 Tax=Nocardia sp. CA-151230 TaxID=3239982 RepID=UPI003D919946
MDITDQAVAEAVTSAIDCSGNKRKAVASAIGISETTLSRRLNAHRPFRVRELLRIARVLQVDPGRFFEKAMEKLS